VLWLVRTVALWCCAVGNDVNMSVQNKKKEDCGRRRSQESSWNFPPLKMFFGVGVEAARNTLFYFREAQCRARISIRPIRVSRRL
jgi:hypothetical protein